MSPDRCSLFIMNTHDRRLLGREIAFLNWGKPYHWGGDDPLQSFDCSGFVIEILKSTGELPRKGDWTAEQLRQMFKDNATDPFLGCLAFRILNGKAYHVEYMIDKVHSIGASGGGSHTLTIQDAIRQNAYIKVRPANFDLYLDPYI